jgi:hypothetical protein
MDATAISSLYWNKWAIKQVKGMRYVNYAAAVNEPRLRRTAEQDDENMYELGLIFLRYASFVFVAN